MNKEKYEFTDKLKRKLLIAGIAGVVLVMLGVLILKLTGNAEAAGMPGESAYNWTQRLITGLWINNIYFIGIALTGLFFFAIQYVAKAGWSAIIIRVPLALGNWLPYAFVLLLVVFFVGNFTSNWHIFHWMDAAVYDKSSPYFDKDLVEKHAYLNVPFYLIRTILFFVVWLVMFFIMKKMNFEEDIKGGAGYFKRLIPVSTIFVVIYAISSSVVAWDWVMSVDAHWYSTLFGWYIFASWFPASLAAITLIVVFLHDAGYLEMLNPSHLHDLGKFVFAFSIFWAYLWFSQYLLIYYTNIPEESVYYVERMKNDIYHPVFFLNLFLNFFVPFLLLMTRDAKRHGVFLKIVCIVVLFGHWMDFYLMITPGALHQHGSFGLIEVGTILIYASAFLYVVLKGLTQSALVPQNHPMLGESLHHHT